jgi:hypothetical protein
MACRSDLERQQTLFEYRQGRKNRILASKTTIARRTEEQAIALAEDMRTLMQWLRQDILAVAGPDYATRQQLYDWVVDELRLRERHGEAGIRAVRVTLENQRDDLLAFARQLDEGLAALARALALPQELVRQALAVQQMSEVRADRWAREKQLWDVLGSKYVVLRGGVQGLAQQVVRASSVVENLNSRLRSYFFLRKQVGPGYLQLLQFYLNHRRFQRSEDPQRQGKSPRELLSKQEHAHWLELLGYQRFARN